VLGWRPTVRLKDGLTKTIPYFERLIASGSIAPAVQP
jgi:hypothetical protein